MGTDRALDALENYASVVGAVAGVASLFIAAPIVAGIAVGMGALGVIVSTYRWRTGYYDSSTEAAINFGVSSAGVVLSGAAYGAKPLKVAVKELVPALKQGISVISAHYSTAAVPFSLGDNWGW